MYNSKTEDRKSATRKERLGLFNAESNISIHSDDDETHSLQQVNVVLEKLHISQQSLNDNKKLTQAKMSK